MYADVMEKIQHSMFPVNDQKRMVQGVLLISSPEDSMHGRFLSAPPYIYISF